MFEALARYSIVMPIAWTFLYIYWENSLCLKFLPHFSIHINKTCYTWSMHSADIYAIHMLGFLSYAPCKNVCIFIQRRFVSRNYFHCLLVVLMMCYGLTCLLWQRTDKGYTPHNQWYLNFHQFFLCKFIKLYMYLLTKRELHDIFNIRRALDTII